MPKRPLSSIRVVIIALSSLAFSSCGGGGGGSPSPPPPGNNTTFGTLAITDANANLIGLAVSLTEGTLSFTQSMINVVVQYAGDGLPQFACGNTGTVSIVHLDRDTSFSISSGDGLNITFVDCYDRVVDAIVDGSVDITISSFSLDAVTAFVVGDIDSNGVVTLTDRFDPTSVATVTADLAFDFGLQVPEVLTVTASGSQQFAIDIDGVVESVSDLAITKSATRLAPGSAAANVNATTTFDFSYDSDFYGGTFSCDSGGISFTGGGDIPDAASIICKGLNNSAIRVTGQNTVGLDAEGDGTFTVLGTLDWGVVVEGFIKTDSGLELDNIVGDINLLRLAIRNNDVRYDATRGRLLIATSAVDAVYPNALVSVSLSTNMVTSLVSFVDEPNLVRISEDGAVIYVSFTDRAEIWPYDANSLQAQPVLEVQSDEIFSASYGIVDLEVSPVDSDQIAVAFQFLGTGNTDITLFKNGSQVPNSYRDSVTGGSVTNYNTIEFSVDGNKLFTGMTFSTGARVLDLNTNGVASSTRLSNVFGPGVKRFGDWLLQGNRVFDGSTLVKIGTYASSFWAGTIDTANSLALILGQGQLTAYRHDTFVPLATYNLGLDDPDLIRDIISAGDFAVLVEDVTLHFLTVADITAVNTGECDIVNAVTNQGEAYTNYACPIDDALYDDVRDKIYAATTSSLGVNGNSIAVIDRPTGSVESYVHIGSEPRFIEMSADGNTLHAIFDGADTVATLDLNTLTVSRVLQIDLTAPSSDPTALEPLHTIRLAPSSVENDSFVVSLGVPSSSPFARLTSFRNGVRLADEVAQSDLEGTPSNSGPFVVFDNTGQPYSLNSGSPPNVQSLSLGATGLSTSVFFNTENILIGEASPDIIGNEVFTSMGGLINLSDQSNEARYDPNAVSFDDRRGGLAVNADVSSNDVYILVGGSGGSGIGRYAYDTGVLTAEQFIEFSPRSFFEEKMFDVGPDQLGIVPNTTSGLVIIDKSAVQ